MPQHTITDRSEIPLEHTWDTASIFPSLGDWQAAVQQVTTRLPEMKRFQGRLGESPQTLLEYFQVFQDLAVLVGQIGLYARLSYAVDTTDQQAKEINDQAVILETNTQAALAFVEPELLSIGFDKLNAFLKDEPQLDKYAHYIDRLQKRAEHIRSAEVEELLSQLGDPFRTASGTHNILVNADLTFQPVQSGTENETIELSHSNLQKLLNSRERTTRRAAWENYADAHLAFKNTQANCLSAGIKQDVFITRARGYSSSLEASLKPNFIPLEVFHNTIQTFQANLNTWHRYWELRRRALKLEQIHVYDTRATLTESLPSIPFPQAVEWICAGMQPMGEEYVSVMRRGLLEERWVDKYPNKGKRFGAFSSGTIGTHPFILMSYNDDILSLSTLAHELGHSMHSYYTRSTQPWVYSYYGLFAAEVASNFNQAMVRRYLLDNQNAPEMQLAIIEEAMNNFHRYFFIMPTLARFELKIHERVERGQALTAQYMMDLMADLFEEGYGPGVAIDRPRVGSVWMQFSTHMYYNFYVYQYATGIAGAQALVNGVLSGSEQKRQDYLAFLKAGGSMYPLDALRMAGVDLSDPQPVEEAFASMAELVDRLERLL